jgi:hypothetical protein
MYMTISLAFLAPILVKAAVDARLPRGIGVGRLFDAPVVRSRQHQMLGLAHWPLAARLYPVDLDRTTSRPDSINGHTDAKGRRSLYKRLSERRAQSIEGYGVDNLGQTASNPRRLRDQEPQVFAIPNFRNTPKWQLW